MFIKGFTKDLRSEGVRFEIGKIYDTGITKEKLEIGTSTVFHFSDQLESVYREKIPDHHSLHFIQMSDFLGEKKKSILLTERFCEIEVLGDLITETDMPHYFGSNKIRIVREISQDELMQLLRKTEGNTGVSNIGTQNDGDFNIGDKNKGRYNIGDHNIGRSNIGAENRGDGNIGSNNTGDNNIGNFNCGDKNIGCYNSGDENIGEYNCGNENIGDKNEGNYNIGNHNTGHFNMGDGNSGVRNYGSFNVGCGNHGRHNIGDENDGEKQIGYQNCGHHNVGNYNDGYWNRGDSNTGNSNQGDDNCGSFNNGNRNSGKWNKCDRSTGFFNTQERTIMVFNQDSGMTFEECQNTDWYQALHSVPFRRIDYFTQRLKELRITLKEHPEITKFDYEKVSDFILKELKNYSMEKAYTEWWKCMTDENKQLIQTMPNFDKVLFKEITGIDVDVKE